MASKTRVLKDHVAAVSCGVYQGTPVTDLDYAEDSQAETDANFVMTGSGGIVEIQGTGEGAPFSRDEFNALFDQAHAAIAQIIELQKQAIGA
jgi:ribonuclease PH